MTDNWKPAVGDRVAEGGSGPFTIHRLLPLGGDDPGGAELRCADGHLRFPPVPLHRLTPYVPGAYPGDAVDEVLRTALENWTPTTTAGVAAKGRVEHILRSLQTVELVEGEYHQTGVLCGLGTACGSVHVLHYVERRPEPHEHTPGEPEPLGMCPGVTYPHPFDFHGERSCSGWRPNGDSVTRCTECGEELP